jgi:hypothetical protein
MSESMIWGVNVGGRGCSWLRKIVAIGCEVLREHYGVARRVSEDGVTELGS